MSESGGDVLVNDVGVVGVSRLFDRTFDGVCEPAVQVLADHELPGVVEDTDVSVCHSFSELTRDLRSGLTQRRSPLTAGCIDADLHPQVEVTLASQANLSSRSHTCIMQCGSCSLKPAVTEMLKCFSSRPVSEWRPGRGQSHAWRGRGLCRVRTVRRRFRGCQGWVRWFRLWRSSRCMILVCRFPCRPGGRCRRRHRWSAWAALAARR